MIANEKIQRAQLFNNVFTPVLEQLKTETVVWANCEMLTTYEINTAAELITKSMNANNMFVNVTVKDKEICIKRVPSWGPINWMDMFKSDSEEHNIQYYIDEARKFIFDMLNDVEKYRIYNKLSDKSYLRCYDHGVITKSSLARRFGNIKKLNVDELFGELIRCDFIDNVNPHHLGFLKTRAELYIISKSQATYCRRRVLDIENSVENSLYREGVTIAVNSIENQIASADWENTQLVENAQQRGIELSHRELQQINANKTKIQTLHEMLGNKG